MRHAGNMGYHAGPAVLGAPEAEPRPGVHAGRYVHEDAALQLQGGVRHAEDIRRRLGRIWDGRVPADRGGARGDVGRRGRGEEYVRGNREKKRSGKTKGKA